MIEIIGGENGELKELKWRELPKNVRQIGETREKRKIYVEDYVVTYLSKLAKPGQAYARGAILFGDLYRTEEGMAVFVSGAMEAQNLEFQMEETIFNEEIWSDILKRGEKTFPKQKVVGWFLSRMGFSVEMNQKILHTHLKNFPGDYKVLYMIDALEKEDAVYICENRQMIRQKGYYIYYEKNSAMQEYMLRSNGSKKSSIEQEESGRSATKNSSKVVEEYRKRTNYDKERRQREFRIRTTRIASLLLILLMCGYIYNQMVELRWIDATFKEQVVSVMARLGQQLGKERKETVEEEVVTADIIEETAQTTENNVAEESIQNEEVVKEGAVEENTTSTETITPSGEGKEAMASFESSKPLYYIVQKGDTLAAISRKMYLSDKYTKQIAWANDLANENQIYEGQKILIPSIK